MLTVNVLVDTMGLIAETSIPDIMLKVHMRQKAGKQMIRIKTSRKDIGSGFTSSLKIPT